MNINTENRMDCEVEQVLDAATASTKVDPESATDALNHVIEHCRRSGALLRTLHYQLHGRKGHVIDWRDIEILVDMALLEIPVDSHEFDIIARFHSDSETATYEHAEQRRATNQILRSLEWAAKPDATVDELNEAVTALYKNMNKVSDGRRALALFCSLLEARGLFVDFVEPGGNFGPWPLVRTEEMRKAARKTARKIKAFVDAVAAETALRTGVAT